MADGKHLSILKQGKEKWSQWRQDNSNITPDLSRADLTRMNLGGANLSKVELVEATLIQTGLDNANLSGSDLSGANLKEADLGGANLSEADLSWADLSKANLAKANLSGAIFIHTNLSGADLSGADLKQTSFNYANLSGANLSGADFIDAYLGDADLSKANIRFATFMQANLSGADLSGADLTQAYLGVVNLTGTDLSGADLSSAHLYGCSLIETDLHEAILVGCNVYGISVWNVNLTDTKQEQLIISRQGDPVITVDNLEVAQFIYLLLNNQRIRHIIDSITTKVVLILGRFTSERKQILDAIREELRRRDYLPVLFDFDKPVNRDITETVSTLAHMARFIIADITAAKSIPQELMRIVPGLPSVPVQPLLQIGAEEYGMFEHFKRFPWVLKTYYYENAESLCSALSDEVVGPVDAKAKELARR